MPKNKVIITIKQGWYSPSVQNGAEYTSVGFMGKTYGSGSPCDTQEEVRRSIDNCKRTIIGHGDIPIVENHLVKRKLTDWRRGNENT